MSDPPVQPPTPPLALDPELEALPEPRRPWRRATLGTLFVVAVGSLSLLWGLWPPARFAFWGSTPREVGQLASVALDAGVAHSWVHGEGALGETAVEYRRPLDPDRYRLSPIAGSDRLWVEVRIPNGIEPERFVPPNSFVGRLAPLAEAGIGGPALGSALRSAFGEPRTRDAWILFDGESPATSRWAVGLAALFVGFAAFGVFGIIRLLLPAKALPDAS